MSQKSFDKKSKWADLAYGPSQWEKTFNNVMSHLIGWAHTENDPWVNICSGDDNTPLADSL